jgi:heme/copper-type cytochrome/quinol oxidase subunit 2
MSWDGGLIAVPIAAIFVALLVAVALAATHFVARRNTEVTGGSMDVASNASPEVVVVTGSILAASNSVPEVYDMEQAVRQRSQIRPRSSTWKKPSVRRSRRSF